MAFKYLRGLLCADQPAINACGVVAGGAGGVGGWLQRGLLACEYAEIVVRTH